MARFTNLGCTHMIRGFTGCQCTVVTTNTRTQYLVVIHRRYKGQPIT
jgi:hypothetical protein